MNCCHSSNNGSFPSRRWFAPTHFVQKQENRSVCVPFTVGANASTKCRTSHHPQFACNGVKRYQLKLSAPFLRYCVHALDYCDKKALSEGQPATLPTKLCTCLTQKLDSCQSLLTVLHNAYTNAQTMQKVANTARPGGSKHTESQNESGT